MKKDKWVWMPHPAHFICSKWCKFHLATYVGGYIVSTVGEYWPDSQVRKIHAQVHDPVWLEANAHLKGDYWDAAYMERFGYEDLHPGGVKYETMVFKAKRRKKNSDGYDCCPWEIESGNNLDYVGYKTATEAAEGHLKLCTKWAKKKLSK